MSVGYKQSSGADLSFSVMLKVDVAADNTLHGTLFVCEERLISARVLKTQQIDVVGHICRLPLHGTGLPLSVEPHAYVAERSRMFQAGVMQIL